MNNFSKNLKIIRKENNLSQEALADELKVSRQAIGKWESGVSYPEMEKIVQICNKYDVSIDSLLNGNIKEEKDEKEIKNNSNNYMKKLLEFVTDIVNMNSRLTFKTKFKCFIEQCFIAFCLFCIFGLVYQIMGGIYSKIFYGILSYKVLETIKGILGGLYILITFVISIIIMVQIFKSRYLNCYKENIINETKDKIELKEEEKIIIRNNDSSGLSTFNNVLLFFLKLWLAFHGIIISLFIIFLFSLFIALFKIIGTGLIYIGLTMSTLSFACLLLIIVLAILNFIFNRKSKKKLMIITFLIMLVLTGIGIGLTFLGSTKIEYQEHNDLVNHTVNIEMRDNLIIDDSINVNKFSYVESDNNDIKITYDLDSLCITNEEYHNISDNLISYRIYGDYDSNKQTIFDLIKNLKENKIYDVNCDIKNINVYTTKENIEILNNNKNN